MEPTRPSRSLPSSDAGRGQDEGCPSSTNAPVFVARRYSLLLAVLAVLTLLFSSCATTRQTPAERAAAAKTLFDRTTKEFHLPSAEANAGEQLRLQNEAARGYEQVLREFRDQSFWCAQAQRSLGNLRAAQGRVDDAVKLFAAVEKKFPEQEWEVLQSWKSAADLLWDAKRNAEAKVFYGKIVTRFDQPDATLLVKTIVRGSRTRLGE